jgi:hypothetical protein
MRHLLKNLWNDDTGALIATEYLFVATILVIGTILGLATLRDAVNVELTELSNAILALSQGYSVSGQSQGSNSTDGSQANDSPQTASNPIAVPPAFPSTIDVPMY